MYVARVVGMRVLRSMRCVQFVCRGVWCGVCVCACREMIACVYWPASTGTIPFSRFATRCYRVATMLQLETLAHQTASLYLFACRVV